jgi:hypothetical protein
MKVKIRKVACSAEEVFIRIEELLKVSERISVDEYIGSSIKTLRASLGIKELEFWELRYNNDQLFNEKFKIIIPNIDQSQKLIIRQCTYNNGRDKNITDLKKLDYEESSKILTTLS